MSDYGAPWTPERVERLKQLWEIEGWSASQIATELGGVTRNAVISKVHRLGLSERTKPAAHGPRLGPPPPRRRSHRTRITTLSAPRVEKRKLTDAEKAILETASRDCFKRANLASPDSRRVTLEELAYRDCKWPLGDPQEEGFAFCAAKTDEGDVYCPFHARLGGNPAQPRQRYAQVDAKTLAALGADK